MEFSTMRNSLTPLLLVACVLGNPISYKASSISSNISPTNKGVSFVVHNIKPRSSDSFDLGENLLDMKEETMELAIEEKENHETFNEATQRTMLRQFLQRSDPVDSLFDLGENVLDMSEETMELAMEEEEGKIEVVDTKENPVQAEVNSSPLYMHIICTFFLFFWRELRKGI